MRLSVRKLLGTTMLVAALALASFGGRPFIEAQQPAAFQTGSLADVLAATASAANVDYFLKVDGIDGESTDEQHKNEIDIDSYSWGASNPAGRGGGGGGGAGKVSFQDIHFTAKVSKASPKLFLACATGQHIKEAVLTARKSGENQFEFLEIRLKDVQITSYQNGSSAGDVVPTDQFSLNFATIEYKYVPQNADGRPGTPVMATYDLKANKGS